MITAAGAGLAFGLSLIVVIGAQNTYVLRQGLRGEHVLAVVLICTLSDVLLIGIGVSGTGVAVDGRPGLLRAVQVGGAAFLFGYAALAARRALRSATWQADAGLGTASLRSVVGTCLAFTWLNPAVYLDTVVLLGSVANARPGHQWWFGGGAAVASALWFAALGFGARLLGPSFRRPRTGKLLDGFVVAVLIVAGFRLLGV